MPAEVNVPVFVKLDTVALLTNVVAVFAFVASVAVVADDAFPVREPTKVLAEIVCPVAVIEPVEVIGPQ